MGEVILFALRHSRHGVHILMCYLETPPVSIFLLFLLYGIGEQGVGVWVAAGVGLEGKEKSQTR